MSGKIKCPECGALFPAETAQKQAFEEREKELARRQKIFEQAARQRAAKEAAEKSSLEVKALQGQLKEREARLEEARQTELDLRRREKALEDQKKEIDLELARRQKGIEEAARQQAAKEAEEKSSLEVKALQTQLKEREARLEEARRTELDLRQREKALEDQKKEIDLELARRQKGIEEAARQQAAKEAEAKSSLEVKALQTQLKEREARLEEARRTELDLRQREKALEDQKKEIDLELARRQKGIEEAAEKKALERRRMKEAEQDKTISDLKKQIGDWQRRAEQGSQKTQGAAQELELEKDLRRLFPFDNIRPVPSGMRGADLIQEVRSSSGSLCGKIIWESKRTKNWSNEWLSKLREDQQEARAEAAVIVTQALPKEVKHFGLSEKILISDYTSFPGLAAILRQNLIEVFSVKRLAENREGKTALLFEYITSPEFRQKIESVMGFLSNIKEETEKEKRYFQRRWAKQEKQLEAVVRKLTGMSGDIEGLAGPSAQLLPPLEIDDESGEAAPGSREE